MNYAKVVSDRVHLNFWDLISMTSLLQWKQLKLILLCLGWDHLSKSQVPLKENQEIMSRFVVLQYLEVHALVYYIVHSLYPKCM